ncbi:hypothetical protein EMWEY_00028170 [Eimeria maxima]|uniref:Uncharacterized protein n=1 Tax=Eimeria maxima TaxID=5804 RepID=U6MCJ1_EIMMA|nr:hypothetical protein EMWEY_00028170 [Eimeria maxima]CDJ60164.1 hypothetical protein EMWEY_00028170 [Eimeria maxima]
MGAPRGPPMGPQRLKAHRKTLIKKEEGHVPYPLDPYWGPSALLPVMVYGRLLLFFSIMRPSADFNKSFLCHIDRYIAELQQVLNGPECGCIRSTWPSASARQTEALGASRCCCSGCRGYTKEKFDEECVSISNNLCEALDGCQECVLMCCTSVLDGVGEMKGLVRPSVAPDTAADAPAAAAAAAAAPAAPAAATESRKILPIFEGLFGLAQVASVSLALILSVLQQLTLWNKTVTKANSNSENVFGAVLQATKPYLHAFLDRIQGQQRGIVDAMDTAKRLEFIGLPPWRSSASAVDFPYTLDDDTLMEEARQRVRTNLCASYIESAVTISSILETRIQAIGGWLQESLSE